MASNQTRDLFKDSAGWMSQPRDEVASNQTRDLFPGWMGLQPRMLSSQGFPLQPRIASPAKDRAAWMGPNQEMKWPVIKLGISLQSLCLFPLQPRIGRLDGTQPRDEVASNQTRDLFTVPVPLSSPAKDRAAWMGPNQEMKWPVIKLGISLQSLFLFPVQPRIGPLGWDPTKR